MRSRHTALAIGLLVAGCGIDLVGTAAPDAGTLAEAGPGPADPPATPEDAGSDARPRDAGADATPVDAGPCGACPSGTARVSCVANACVESRRVFVSSTGSLPNFGATGTAALAAADARCQALASDASRGGTWNAWLSIGTLSAKDRLSRAAVPYRLLDGTLIGTTFDELVLGNGIAHAIDRNERGELVTGEQEVWTGTNSNGNVSGPTCNDFTSASNGFTASVGNLTMKTPAWTYALGQFCDRTAQRIYCFEQ